MYVYYTYIYIYIIYTYIYILYNKYRNVLVDIFICTYKFIASKRYNSGRDMIQWFGSLGLNPRFIITSCVT